MGLDRSEAGVAPEVTRPGERLDGAGAAEPRLAARAARKPAVRAKTTHRSLEQALVLLVIIGGLPAALALLYLTWGQEYSFEVRWTVTAIVLAVWLGAAVAAYQMVTRALYLQANLLGALRE